MPEGAKQVNLYTPARPPIVDLSISTPGYLETMDIELLSGGALTESDDADSPLAALVY